MIEIDGGRVQYWLEFLADKVSGSSSEAPLHDYEPLATKEVGRDSDTEYSKRRKYDARLRPRYVEKVQLSNVLVNVEFTETDVPAGFLRGKTSAVTQDKLRQTITNGVDMLVHNPSRLLVPSLSFHGRGTKTVLVVFLLSHEGLDYTFVEGALGANLPLTAAILGHLRASTIFQLGYNSLFEYDLESEAQMLLPKRLYLPSCPEILTLCGKALSHTNLNPFSRSTWISIATMQKNEQEKPVVVKMAHISDARAWREGIILETLSKRAKMSSVPVPVAGYAAQSNCTNLAPTFEQQTSQASDSARFQSRHLEIYVLDVPVGQPLKAVADLNIFVDLVCQLFRVVLDAYQARVIHRDLSSGNVIFSEKTLYVIDWEAGKRLDQISPENTPDVTGTLDTMPIWRLRDYPAMSLAAEAESATYVAIKTLLQICKSTVDQSSKATEQYMDMLRVFRLDGNLESKESLADARYKLWTPEAERISLCLANYGFHQAATIIKGLLQHDFYSYQPVYDYPQMGAGRQLTDEAVAAQIKEHMEGLKSLIANTVSK